MNQLQHSIAALPVKGWYAHVMRVARTADQDAVARDPMCQFGTTRPVREIRHAIRRALDRRINARAGDHEANQPIPIELWRDVRRVEDMLFRRIRVYQLETAEMQARYGHLLASRND